MYHILFIPSSVDGHLSCFCLLAIMSCAAGVHVRVCGHVLIFLGYILRNGIAASSVTPCSNFSGTATWFSKATCTTFPTSSIPGFSLLSFWYNHPSECELVSCCGFDFHFPVEHLFMCLVAICMPLLEKCLFKSSAHLKLSGLSFFFIICESFKLILNTNPLSHMWFAKDVSLIL